MDKYRRNDDPNDDLEVYRQKEVYENMSIFDTQSNPQQPTKVFSKRHELVDQVEWSKEKLSIQENMLLNLIVNKGYSIRRAAKRMKIKQQTAQVYWNRIKEKLDGNKTM